MSYDNYKTVLDSANLSNHKQQEGIIKRVGARIQKAVEEFMAQNNALSQLNGYKWEFNLIDENVANAWCMPGGKVAFYTGHHAHLPR